METGLLGMKEVEKNNFIPPIAMEKRSLIPPNFEIEVFKVTPPKYKEIDNLQLQMKLQIIDIRNLNKIIETELFLDLLY